MEFAEILGGAAFALVLTAFSLLIAGPAIWGLIDMSQERIVAKRLLRLSNRVNHVNPK